MELESRDHQHQAEVCTGTHQSDYTFKEEHVPELAEALAGVAHKWEEIALALRLPEAVQAECDEARSLILKLERVLYKWIVGQHSNAKPATRENLKTALASPLVQHPQLASELEDKLKTSLSLHTLTTSQKESIFQSIFQSGVRRVLVEKYSQCPEVPRGSWPPVVSKTFINLALIETSDQPLKSDYSIRGDADDVLAEKKEVKYEKIFSTYEISKKFLILGRPGSGKTTLVHKLVRDWSAGKALQGAELVFLISLRMLSSESDKSLPDILQCIFFDKTSLMQVCEAIERAQGERVCFIFDGFDEYSSSCKPKSVIFALLDKSYLVDAMIIVTSRPAAASKASTDDKIFDKPCKKIEVFGFSKSQITEYINCFPFSSSSSGNEAHAKKLQSFLLSRPGVLDLCYLPVNCAIICFIYDTEPDHLPDTQTQIYTLFTKLIIIRQLTSRYISRELDSLEDLEGQEAEDFKKLCSLAFDMTTHSQQVITRGPTSSDEAHSLGLVTTDITAGLSGYKNSYSFLHLTLQEFLAAYHLSKLNQEEQMSLIEKYGYSIHMQIVWKFFFGLVNFKTRLDRAQKLFTGIQGRTPLFPIQCSYEAKQTAICRLASSHKFYFIGTLSNYDISAIAYTMSMAAAQASLATPTTRLKCNDWGPGDDKLSNFFCGLNNRALISLEELSIIKTYNISIMDLEALAERMSLTEEHGLKNLKSLELGGDNIGDEGVAILATGLDGNHVLEELDLFDNAISATGINALMKSDCQLRVLNLSHNDIGDEGVAILAAGLDGNHVLETLNLQSISISAAGVSELFSSDTHLRHLNMSCNDIGSEGARAVAKGLRGNMTLESIDLSDNNIGISGVEALACVIQKPLYLDLSSNIFTSLPTGPLDNSTSVSNSLNFTGTRDITTEDVKVEEVQGHCNLVCNLVKLDLSDNHCYGDVRRTISKFKSLSHLLLSELMNVPEVLAVVDYVAHSDNCKQLKFLGQYSVLYESPVNRTPHHLFSGFIIDKSRETNKTEVVSFLQTVRNYDRVGAVYLHESISMNNEKTITDLKEAFQHDQIARLIIYDIIRDLYIQVPASGVTSESVHESPMHHIQQCDEKPSLQERKGVKRSTQERTEVERCTSIQKRMRSNK